MSNVKRVAQVQRMEVMADEFYCDSCGYEFDDASKLHKNQREKHGMGAGQEWFLCDFCINTMLGTWADYGTNHNGRIDIGNLISWAYNDIRKRMIPPTPRSLLGVKKV